MTHEKPPIAQLGARIRIKAEYADAADELFRELGVAAIYIDRRADADISYWFGKMADGEIARMLQAMPRAYFALQARVGTIR